MDKLDNLSAFVSQDEVLTLLDKAPVNRYLKIMP
jgi:hypothetical protein